MAIYEEKSSKVKYIQFRTLIQKVLLTHPAGYTWKELRDKLDLPYDQPCPTWVKQLEEDIGLFRVRETGRAYIWKIPEV
jgi:hypothetical protein